MKIAAINIHREGESAFGAMESLSGIADYKFSKSFKKKIGDYSAALNSVLGMVKETDADWVIRIDTDERLAVYGIYEGDIVEGIRTLIEYLPQDCGAIPIRIVSPHKRRDGTTYIDRAYQTRLFRNDKRIVYSGKIHEGIGRSLRKAGYRKPVPCYLPFYIAHLGYDLSVEGMWKKYEDKKEMTLKQVKENPCMPQPYWHLANLAKWAGQDAVAEKYMGVFKNFYEAREKL